MPSKKEKNFEKRIENESLGVRRVTNDSLICKDCIYRLDDSEIFGNTSRCEVYDDKSKEVLLGGRCDDYTREVRYREN